MKNRVIGIALAATSIGGWGCSSHETPGESSFEAFDGALRGEFIEQIATFDDGTSSSTYFLRVGGNDRDVRELVFDIEPNLLSQTQVKVWGTAKDGRIIVERMEEIVSSDTASQAL